MGILNFFGDVYLCKPTRTNVPLEGEYVFNLESPLTCSSQPVWGKINLKSEGVYFKETFGKNPLAVCLANNHIMDYGNKGFLETVENLQKHGIKYFGAGHLADNCHNPLIMTMGSQRIALLGYVCPTTHPIFAAGENFGVSPIDSDAIARDILVAKKSGAERIIVQLHWGKEDVGLPRPADVALAHHLLELGADLIIGHHAHCIQPFEIFNGKYIFYGLGNALFPNTERIAFSKEGLPEGNQQMKWKKRNNKSLTVSYDTISGLIKIRLLFFGNSLAVVHGAALDRVFALKMKTDAQYERKYAWILRMSILRCLAASFLSRPRIPKKKNIQWLLNLFKTDKS
jgi:poly-gamma-glutamate synthesis protein (capsule biosynthesis protein)